MPWTVYLAVSLPVRHVQTGYYDVDWAGFDMALAVALTATGVGLVRRSRWAQTTAVVAATMLFCDAWFDVLGSTGFRGRLESTGLAVGVELPTAFMCLGVARQVEEAMDRAASYAEAARRLSGRHAHADDPESPAR